MHVGHYYVMLDNALLYDQIFDVLSMLHHFHLLTSVHLMWCFTHGWIILINYFNMGWKYYPYIYCNNGIILL